MSKFLFVLFSILFVISCGSNSEIPASRAYSYETPEKNVTDSLSDDSEKYIYGLFKDSGDREAILKKESDMFDPNFSFVVLPNTLKIAFSKELKNLKFLFDNTVSHQFDGIYVVDKFKSVDSGTASGVQIVFRDGGITRDGTNIVITNNGKYAVVLNGERFLNIIENNSSLLNSDPFEDGRFIYIFRVLIHELFHVFDSAKFYISDNDLGPLYLAKDEDVSKYTKIDCISSVDEISEIFCKRRKLIDTSFNRLLDFENKEKFNWNTAQSIKEAQAFVTDYAKTDFAEDFAETLKVYYLYTRYNVIDPSSSEEKINAASSKICTFVDTVFNQTFGLQEDCMKCLNGGCKLEQSNVITSSSSSSSSSTTSTGTSTDTSTSNVETESNL